MAINSFEYEKGSGFEEDRFNRKGFAEKLASKLTKEGPASVFALDAPWGSGKTIFLQQFADLLKCGAEKKEQWNVIYYDAFKEDFAEDALLPLVSAILEGLAEEQSTTSQIEKVGKSALPIAKRLLGSGIRGALKWASAGLLDGKKISDVATEAITEELDSAGDLIYENLVGNDAKRQEQEIFVSALNDAFEAFEGSQTLIIIDELDRCRPEFAIQTLERVKHIFGKVNCTFLFGVNRQELAAIVQGYYGPEFSGGKYLQRFFDFELTFPARRGDSIALQHLSSLAQKPQDHRGITRYVQRMLEVNFLRFEPTLRDIEKIVQFGRYRELRTTYGVPELMLASCLIVAKVCRPEEFKQLVSVPPESQAWLRLFRTNTFLSMPQKQESEAFSGFLQAAILNPSISHTQAEISELENHFHLAKGNFGSLNGPYLIQMYADHFLQGLD